MHSADYAVASCPSVHPSVTRRYYVETAKLIIKLFHRWVATPFCSFSTPNVMAVFFILMEAANAGCIKI